MTVPKPDTSPGDELDEIFKIGLEAHDELRGAESASDVRRGNELLAEAKDRLNRLMLTRERELLMKLKGRGDNAIPERIAAIDAQLNKEETDGDVPTHSEPSKP